MNITQWDEGPNGTPTLITLLHHYHAHEENSKQKKNIYYKSSLSLPADEPVGTVYW